MRTEVIETVMTREYWERNYRREYRRHLREYFVETIMSICKAILSVIIVILGAFSIYGAMAIIAIIVESLCNMDFLFTIFNLI